ncbi:MAG: ribosome-associated translation inhibitor RaiA [Acidobacteria bacterium]|nr:MAG: ribosome-associated translation inhibitor RaiA [Acidobacteriota bacterium]
MSVDITGRHIEITPALREFTVDKLQKLHKYLDDIIETHVILAVEKHRHIAEIVVHARTATMSGSGETEDMYSAIGLVMEKLERQAKKHKEKIKRRNKKKGAESIRTALPPAPETEMAGPSAGEPPRIVRTNSYLVKPMTPEEAVLEVDGSHSEFVVFRNSISQRISVLYRRPDGSFGLIEP